VGGGAARSRDREGITARRSRGILGSDGHRRRRPRRHSWPRSPRGHGRSRVRPARKRFGSSSDRRRFRVGRAWSRPPDGRGRPRPSRRRARARHLPRRTRAATGSRVETASGTRCRAATAAIWLWPTGWTSSRAAAKSFAARSGRLGSVAAMPMLIALEHAQGVELAEGRPVDVGAVELAMGSLPRTCAVSRPKSGHTIRS
jgi:hypothetical protein